MSHWTRTAPLAIPSHVQTEQWTCAYPNAAPRTFEMWVKTGKPLDVLGLKNTTLDELRDYSRTLLAVAQRLYADGVPRHKVRQCPCCLNRVVGANEVLRIFEIPYIRCSVCGHVFIADQPDQEAMKKVFAESENHSQIYIDYNTIEIRMQEVIEPKIQWLMEIFYNQWQSDPTTCVDIGAGGGHFVEGMRRRGINTCGFELSQTSCRFAKDAFGLELITEDFLTFDSIVADVVTMWGLLEYTPEPRKFLAKARQCLHPDRGLLIVEVPRFDALGTVAQAQNSETIARHMDPTSHLNCFSDNSLATALVETGFYPVAAWYFGMDIYELFVQTALRIDDEQVLKKMADMIPALQCSCDAGRQCDDLIMAAIPAP